MKLGELAYIRKGLKIPKTILTAIKPANYNTFSVIEAANFQGVVGKFVSEKEIRKNGGYSKKDLLEYGDYLLVLDKMGRCRIFRHTETSGVFIPSEDIIVITGGMNILENFLGHESNRRYICSEVEKNLTHNGLDILKAISQIDIYTDNIKELEESNESEQIGIRKPIQKTDIPFNLSSKPLTLDKLMKRILHNELLLDTDFQRRPGLWDIPTKSRLIEAIIVRLPIPAFYFDGSDDNQWLVIDGLQRISAVMSFMNNEFSLTELDYLPELEEKTFNMLERPFQRNIEEYEIFAYIIQKGTPQAVKYKIFKNINTSALILEPQEIRHSINPGKPSELLKAVANSVWYKNAVSLSDRQCDRMYDRETVLRFIAFQEFRLGYAPTIVEFLDESMTKLYDIPRQRLENYKQQLEIILADVISVFGEPPFSRSFFKITNTAYRHNNIIFELITYAFSKNNRLVQQKELTKAKFIEFFTNRVPKFWDIETAYSQEGLFQRFESIEKLIKDIR